MNNIDKEIKKIKLQLIKDNQLTNIVIHKDYTDPDYNQNIYNTLIIIRGIIKKTNTPYTYSFLFTNKCYLFQCNKIKDYIERDITFLKKNRILRQKDK